MFARLKGWFSAKNPDGVDRRQVRIFLRLLRRFNREYKRPRFGRCCEIGAQMRDMRAHFNQATDQAVDRAMNSGRYGRL